MDAKTIKHIASLARIELTQKEEERMKEELSSILGYVEQLNKVDTSGVEPLYQTTGLINSMREDTHRGDFSAKGGPASGWKMDNDLNEKLIGQAPHKENRFVKVKSILNK